MAISIVQTAEAYGTCTNTPTFASAVTPGNTIIVVSAYFGGGLGGGPTVALRDMDSNTYYNATYYYNSTQDFGVSIDYAYDVASASLTGLQVEYNAPGCGTDYGSSTAYEVSGLGSTNPIDQVSNSNGSVASGTTSGTASSGTTAATTTAKEIIIGGMALSDPASGSPTVTTGSGYSGLLSDGYAGDGYFVYSESQILSTTGTQTANFNLSTLGTGSVKYWNGAVATFKQGLPATYPYPGEPLRLPIVGADDGTWGEILNNFLSSSLTSTGFLSNISSQSSNYTINSSSSVGETVLANASSGSITITLPSAVNNGNLYTIKKVDSSTTHSVTVATIGSQTINGQSSIILQVQYTSITLASDGSNWNVI